MLRKMLGTIGAVLAIVCGFGTSASAGQVYYFASLTNNSNPQVPGGQFTVKVFGTGDLDLANYGGPINSNQSLFVFENNVGTHSSITDVYFQGDTLLEIDAIRQSAGVSFRGPAHPANLPGGRSLNPDFITTNEFSADADTAPHGVNSRSEWVGILFNLEPSETYKSVINAIGNWAYDESKTLADRWTKINPAADSLRFGIHVSSIGTLGTGDSYVSVPRARELAQLQSFHVLNPEPSSLVLLVIGSVGLFGAAGARRRRACK